MSRGHPKSSYRPKSASTLPFDIVLDRLGMHQDAPRAAPSPSRVAPAGGWTYPAAEAAPASASAAAAEMYVDAEASAPTPNETTLSLEETVALELQISDDLGLAELERMRRTFAYRNHPDRVGPSHKARALQRMTVANVLIDQALKAARARAR